MECVGERDELEDGMMMDKLRHKHEHEHEDEHEEDEDQHEHLETAHRDGDTDGEELPFSGNTNTTQPLAPRTLLASDLRSAMSYVLMC